MKLLLENWRKLLKEDEASGVHWNMRGEAGLREDGIPEIQFEIEIDPDQDLESFISEIEMELIETIYHEVTHLGQEEMNFRKVDPEEVQYYGSRNEVEAFASGMLAKARATETPESEVVRYYLEKQVEMGRLERKSFQKVMDLWLEKMKELKPEIEQAKKKVAEILTPQLLDIIRQTKGEKKVDWELAPIVWDFLADPEDESFTPSVFIIRDPKTWPR